MTMTAASRGPLRGTGPLWQRLADELRQRIASGEFRVAFPGELALAEHYGVSRHTVREALRDLRAAGLVTASRGKTSHVVAPTLIEQPTHQLYSLFASVQHAGLTQRSVVCRRMIRPSPDAAHQLGLAPETELFYLERLRLADEQPLAIDSVWLPANIARPLLDADFSDTSLYEQLQRTCGVVITGGRERVSASIPDAAVRGRLGIDQSVAVLTVDRIGFVDQAPIEWRQSVLRGDLFSMTAQYPPSAPPPARPAASSSPSTTGKTS